MDEKCLRVGVGFATGRRSFQNVLRSYVYHLEESGFVAPGRVSLTLLVAFDPAYSGTARADYENMEPRVRQWFDEVAFFSPEDVENAAEALVKRGVAPAEEKRLLFGNGYAAQRNMALYEAMRRHLDCLIFFDDDEYPMAVTSSDSAGVALWSGQHVIEAHVKYLRFADVTNGYHCGYISPLPSLGAGRHTGRKYLPPLHRRHVQRRAQVGGRARHHPGRRRHLRRPRRAHAERPHAGGGGGPRQVHHRRQPRPQASPAPKRSPRSTIPPARAARTAFSAPA